MDQTPYRPLLILIALLGVGAVALTRGVGVTALSESGVRPDLPDAVGSWQGEDIFYCQNAKCLKVYAAHELTNTLNCAACGGRLDPGSPAERDFLPPDTSIRRKLYNQPDGRQVCASVVLSGADRSSIHRPQLCLVAMGNVITHSQTLDVPLADGRQASVMVLDLSRRVPGPNGATVRQDSYYAYWFVGPRRETPYHTVRMFWMAWDRLVHSVTYRWSYVSVTGLRAGRSSAHVAEVRDFIRDLYPALVLATPRA